MIPKDWHLNDFEKMLDKCVDLHVIWEDHHQHGGYKLGHYDRKKSLVCIYNTEHSEENLARLKAELDTVGVRYRLVPLSVFEGYCNVNILDIGV